MTSPYTALPLVEVQEAAAQAYEVYGEVGRSARGYSIYLARELSPEGRLVLLELVPVGADAAGGTEYALELCGEVQKPGSVPGRMCPSCGTSDPRSGRFCALCRYNFSESPSPIQTRQDLLEQVQQQTSNTYEILGELDQVQGPGIAYFARDRATGAVLALRLQRSGTGADAEEYSLEIVQSLDSLLTALPQEGSGSEFDRQRTLVRRRGLARRQTEPDEFSADALPAGWGREHARQRPRRMHWTVGVMILLFLAGSVVLGVTYWQRSRTADLSGGTASIDTTPVPLPETVALPPIEPAPARDSGPAVPAKVSLHLKSLPLGAVFKVDGVRTDSLVASVTSGSHTLSITAPGHRELVKTVRVAGDTTLDLGPDLARLKLAPQVAISQPKDDACQYPGDQYNASNECYDEPPRLKRGSTRVQLPSDFDGMPRPSTIWAKVSAGGRTLSVEPSKRSVPEFEEMAFRRAYSLEWDPATKAGKPVAGWVEVEIRPVAP